MERENSIRIAVVEEQIKGIREQQRSHSESTQKRFDAIDAKMDELMAVINRGRGAYAASLAIAAVVGGMGMKLGGFILQLFGR